MEQKINFQKRMENILETVKESEKAPSLLLHSCCGPCSSYVLECLTAFFEVTVFYYNPNIYPEEEYEKRLSEQRRLIETVYGNRVGLMTLPYDHNDFLVAADGFEAEPEGGARCEKCFQFRLDKTAELAKENGFDFFATTLTVSPHKNAMILNRIGHESEKRIGSAVCWLESDFKKKNGYLRSIELSKELNLYRQIYCGCEFSQTSL
ncbi:MAG: epoxyqueuosine reductase QueH [Parasporobacterium sp.]|nr:epoxyqueuosine reductase QueH [Parasporobacterium sp.]